MGNKSGKNTVNAVWDIALPIAESIGLDIWDVQFVKEGSTWYLRIFIDKEDGVTVDDCEALSRAVDAPLDEADPIDHEYILEVSSPGIERELTRPEHFEYLTGEIIAIKLYRPRDGKKEIIGTLAGYSEDVITIIDQDENEVSIPEKDAVSTRLYYSGF